MKWKAISIEDATYFRLGDIFGGMDEPRDRHKELVVSNSFLKKVYETNLHHFIEDGYEEISEDLQEVFDLGSAFHCYILENKEFGERYRVSDVIDASDERVRIGLNEFKFIEQSSMSIGVKYPYITNNENAEITIMGEVDGIPVKCKIDKLHIEAQGSKYTMVEIIDLKGVYFDMFKLKKDSNKDRWELRKMLSKNGYDLQAYFYKRLVEGWLASIGQAQCEVVFSLIVASKETYKVQKFRTGSEMMETGRMKFESVWGDIRDFVLHGKAHLSNEEVL